MAGWFGGLVFAAVLLVAPGNQIAPSQAAMIGAGLGVCAWVTVLGILGVVGNYVLGDIGRRTIRTGF
jgi:hypothetical protein